MAEESLGFLLWGSEAPLWEGEDALDDAINSFPAGGDPTFAPGSTGVVQLRCLDATHAPGCALCMPSPEDPSTVELRGEGGRKNGEKRLRCLLCRTVEWLSPRHRAEAVTVLGSAPEHAKLVSALRNRHSVELRKADLLLLCRLWGLQSDIWRSKLHGRAKSSPAPQPSSRVLALPLAAAAAPSSQLSSPAEARSLAQLSAQAFGDTSSTEQLLALHSSSPPHTQPGLAEVLRRKMTRCRLARDATVRVTQLLRVHHAAVQAELAMLTLQAGAQPAWLSRVGREEELDKVLKTLRGLCKCAVGAFHCIPAPSTAVVLEEVSGGEQAQVPAAGELAVVGASPPSPSPPHNGADPCIRLGGQHALHLLTHVNSTLALAKHDSYARFLDATASLASLLIAHTTAVAEGFDRHAHALESELGQHPPAVCAH